MAVLVCVVKKTSNPKSFCKIKILIVNIVCLLDDGDDDNGGGGGDDGDDDDGEF